jgi:hypothetical protein
MGMGQPRTGRVCGLALMAAVAAAAGCSVNLGGPQVVGSGVRKTEKRDVKGFDRIEVGGATRLEYAPGKDTTVEVSTDDNLLPLLVTEVSGDTLKVSLTGNTSTSLGVTVKVTTPKLKGVSVAGASTAALTGLAAKELHLDVSGASNVTASGTADRLDIDCSGASHVHAKDLTAQTVAAHVSGASSAEVHADKELKAHAEGASSIRYSGTPGKTETSVGGASSVKKE